MNWALYVMAGFLVVSLLCYISLIGKPREPVTPADAIRALIVIVPIVSLMVVAGWRLT